MEIRFFHKNQEPPPVTYSCRTIRDEFYFNEVGWQDPITVTVNYNLPCCRVRGGCWPATSSRPGGPDKVARPSAITATFTPIRFAGLDHHGNEGEKSLVIPYVYTSNVTCTATERGSISIVSASLPCCS